MAQNQGLHPLQPWPVSTADSRGVPVNQVSSPWGQTASGVGGEELTVPHRHDQIVHPNPVHLQKRHVTPGFDAGIRRLEDLWSTVGGSYRGVRR